MVANDHGQLLWARRIGGQNGWQFPQGGINEGESPEGALYRELEEEVGLNSDNVEVLASTRGWLRYRLPKRFVRRGQNPVCIGQNKNGICCECWQTIHQCNWTLIASQSLITGSGLATGIHWVRWFLLSGRSTGER
jgi:8-oxo-dGTP pyrophosphatase MutT (NUDIX family)